MDWWPQCTWKTIHNFSACIDEDDIENYVEWLELTIKLLCCKECRKNGMKELEYFPVRKFIEASLTTEEHDNYKITEKTGVTDLRNISINERSFLWSYLVHDMVNIFLTKKGKKRVTLEYSVVKKIYWTRLGL